MSTAQQDTNLIGCDFDAATAKALSGNDIVALVTDKTGTELLAVSGQQGLKFNMSQDNTEAATKDDAIGGWTLKFASSKSWDASIDGLYSPDDSATKTVAKALAEGEYLCLKVCKRIRTSANTKYVPLRMGLRDRIRGADHRSHHHRFQQLRSLTNGRRHRTRRIP